MKRIVILISLCLASLLVSCVKPKVVYKTKVIYKQCPKINVSEPPQFEHYSVTKLEWKDNYYYCTNLDNAKIIVTNWIEYQNWCQTMYDEIKQYNNFVHSSEPNKTKDKK